MLLYFWIYNSGIGSYYKAAAVDYSSSVIWVGRYDEPGEFEVYLRADKRIRRLAYQTRRECIITKEGSDTAMLVERIKLTCDPENGDYMTISGRSVEAILARRIAARWDSVKHQYLFTFSGTAENLIRQLITDNIIRPDAAQEWRKIDGFSLGEAQGYTDSVEAQLLGENLLDVIQAICKQFGYGFRIRFDGNFVFELYKGTDRSAGQSENPRLVFSSEMQNVASIEWSYDEKPMRTVCFIGGEGEGYDRKVTLYGRANPPGAFGHEMWFDGSSLSSKTEDGSTLTPDQYQALLIDTAKTALAEANSIYDMQTEAIPVAGYMYGVDYFLGDKITCMDDYGDSSDSIVTEVTEVEDESGIRVIPKFSNVG